MPYRLLMTAEVSDTLTALPPQIRSALRRRLSLIQESPANYSDYTEYDAKGRLLDVHLHAGYAISYWNDFADRHILVMDIQKADR